jgi:preprotein translocase subunit SecE
MARKRPGDDAAGDRPEDEVYEEAIADGVVVPDDDELVPDDADVDDADDDEDGEPIGRGGTAVRERKASGSPKAKKEVRRAGIFGRIGGFFREVVGELRKVIWPTRKELLTYTGVVIGFVTIMVAIVAVLDYGFAKAVLFSFGSKS